MDTVNHYDIVGKVDAQKIDLNHCYNEYGTASYVKVTEGKVVAKAGGKIEVVFANNTDSSKVAVTQDSGEIEVGYTTVIDVSDVNKQRLGGITLEVATAQVIEETGELSVASETGVLPAGMDYTAVVKNVGYNSLGEAMEAASAGDTISLLKNVLINQKANSFDIKYTTSSTLSVGAGLVISKNLTINGNNHSITTTSKGSCSKGVSIAIVSSNIKLSLLNVSVSTSEMSNIYVGEGAANVSVNVENSSLTVTSSYGYSIKTCNGSNNFALNIVNSTVDAWATVNARSSNSKFIIKDSLLTGENRAAQSSSNDYATICIDGDGYSGFPHAGNPGVCGSNNIMNIENCRVSATSQSTNAQSWLCIQYGAKNNVVTVKGGDIRSASSWTYTESENGLTNTVTVDGIAEIGVLD